VPQDAVSLTRKTFKTHENLIRSRLDSRAVPGHPARKAEPLRLRKDLRGQEKRRRFFGRPCRQAMARRARGAGASPSPLVHPRERAARHHEALAASLLRPRALPDHGGGCLQEGQPRPSSIKPWGRLRRLRGSPRSGRGRTSQPDVAEKSRVPVHQWPRLAEEAQPSCVPLAYLLAQTARSRRLRE
jgi:hypothetical protein